MNSKSVFKIRLETGCRRIYSPRLLDALHLSSPVHLALLQITHASGTTIAPDLRLDQPRPLLDFGCFLERVVQDITEIGSGSLRRPIARMMRPCFGDCTIEGSPG
jgi:hypothetical protein